MKNENLNLKLIGRNSEDLKTISAYLQDSVVVQKDIIFLKANKIFYESIHLSPHGYHHIQTELKAFSEKSAWNAHADRGFTGTVLDCGIGTVV